MSPVVTIRLVLTVLLGAAVAGQAPPGHPELGAKSVSSQTSPSGNGRKTGGPGGYVGDDKCRSCHSDMFETFHQTAHYLTSRLPSADSIHGKFTPGENLLQTSNPVIFFRMDANDKGFFQTAVIGKAPHTTLHTERFDLVIGSGRKGQTYLFWKGDQLFELPVSYWAFAGHWTDSPGYRDGFINFNRLVLPRCLGCHATYFESLSPPGNRYNHSNYVLGISCETCHGGGREHITRRSAKSEPESGQAIVNPARLSRDRQMDLCALCHAGAGVQLNRAFIYTPGEPLDKYLELPSADPDPQIDVHGNQVELLKKSRCFQSSAMTCLTCHDVHLPQRDLAAFSQRCIACHKVESCGLYPKAGRQIAGNCIDCHMPNDESRLVVVSGSDGGQAKLRVRNHWIKVYPILPAR